jgi:hypothetical protein
MEPNVWGKHLWYSLHYIALGYPTGPSNKDKESYRTFFTSLCKVIPCEHCCEHYSQYLVDHPISASLGSRLELFEWTWRCHNAVNERLGKPVMTYEVAWATYTNGVEAYGNMNGVYFLLFVCVLLVGVIIAILSKANSKSKIKLR